MENPAQTTADGSAMGRTKENAMGLGWKDKLQNLDVDFFGDRANESDGNGKSLISVSGGGRGNEWALSFLNGSQDGADTSASLLDSRNQDGSTSIVDTQLHDNGGFFFDSHLATSTDNTGKDTNLGNFGFGIANQELRNGDWFTGVAIDASVAEQEAANGDHTDLLGLDFAMGTTQHTDGSTTDGTSLDASVVETNTDVGTVTLVGVTAESGVRAHNGVSQMSAGGNAAVMSAGTHNGNASVDLGQVGFSAHSGNGGFGGGAYADAAHAQGLIEVQDADGNSGSLQAELRPGTELGGEVSWDDQNGDGVEYKGAEVNSPAGGATFYIIKDDLNHDGETEVTGAEVGGYTAEVLGGTGHYSRTDRDNNGVPETNVAVSSGPVSVATSQESWGSAWETTKAVGNHVKQTAMSGWDGFKSMWGDR